MDAWQILLIHLFREGRQWVSKLDRNDWRKVIANTPGPQVEPPLQIIQDESEAINWVRSERLLDCQPRKGFVIAPDRYSEETLMLLAPFPLSIGDPLKLSLQLGIMLNIGQEKSFFGYRFESPEEHEEHNYYHVQPIQSFGRGPKSTHSIQWYPDKYPTIPLNASNGIELVVSVLLSCRKWQRLTELASSSTIGQAVKDPMNEFLGRIKNIAA